MNSNIYNLLEEPADIFIKSLYKIILYREVESNALIYYVNRLQGGASREMIICEIYASNEANYYKNFNNYFKKISFLYYIIKHLPIKNKWKLLKKYDNESDKNFIFPKKLNSFMELYKEELCSEDLLKLIEYKKINSLLDLENYYSLTAKDPFLTYFELI